MAKNPNDQTFVFFFFNSSKISDSYEGSCSNILSFSNNYYLLLFFFCNKYYFFFLDKFRKCKFQAHPKSVLLSKQL